ncbi:MAG: TRAP transporter large permease [Bacillota bacterium]
MNYHTTALIGIGVLVMLMLLRMPVGYSMLLTGFLGLMYIVSPAAAYNMLGADIWEQFSSYSLSVIPLFILMGSIVFHSGTAEGLYRTAYKWIGHMRGGLASTTIMASIGFAAICGSNSASAATIGTLALPQMRKYGYDPALSAGSVACGGTLGVIIPPSVTLIVMAIQTEQSVGKLFVANIIPGVLIGLLFMLTIYLLCLRKPELGPAGERYDLKTKIAALPGTIETLILFALVIGGLYGGIFTPTEAGAAGAFGAMAISLAQRKLSREAFTKAVLETVRISAMVMVLITGAVVFGHFLTISRLPFFLADWVAALPVPSFVVLSVIILIYFLGGMFMDALGFLVVTIPIFYPLALVLGYDPLWFLVILNVLTTMGAVTPPVGVCAYIVSGLSRHIPLHTVFKGVMYFLPAYFIVIVILMLFPELVTFLAS